MFHRTPYQACPLCISRNFSEHHVADCSGHANYTAAVSPVMRWVRCGDCGHVFTDGYWPDEALAEVFKKTHAEQSLWGGNFNFYRELAAQTIDRLTAYLGPPGGRWLDVGFGNGALLFTAQEYGFEPVGLELRPGAAEEMATFGVEAHNETICTFARTDPGGFSVVSMADVLEHIPYPIPTLEAARSLLNNNGALFVSMPNMAAPIWRHYDRNNNPFWVEIEHYHNFTRERLYALLRETGFDPVSYGVSGRYIMCMEVIAKPI